MRPVEVRLRDLPTVETSSGYAYDCVRAGEWTFDPHEEDSPAAAWNAAKAWAAYALWLQNH